MIDIIVIGASIIGAEFGLGLIGYGIYKAIKPKKQKTASDDFEKLGELLDDILPPVVSSSDIITEDGMIIIDKTVNSPKEVIMTVEEHAEFLKNKYPAAYDDFKKRGFGRYGEPAVEGCARILRNIISVESGEMTATIDRHHLSFSNGDRVWIANEYFAYGHLTDCSEPGFVFSDSRNIDDYTFLRIVDLHRNLSPKTVEWKLTHVRVKM